MARRTKKETLITRGLLSNFIDRTFLNEEGHRASDTAIQHLEAFSQMFPEVETSRGINKILGWLDEHYEKGSNKDIYWEDLCAKFDIPMQAIVSALTQVAISFSHSHATTMLGMSMPKIVETMTNTAQTEGGFRDRELALKMSGLLKEGPSVVVNNNNNTLVNSYSGSSFAELAKGFNNLREIESTTQPQLLLEGEISETIEGQEEQ